MNNPSKIALLVLAVGLSACAAVTSTDQVMKPAEVRSGFMGLSTASDVKVERPGPFKDLEQVVIASFKVAFIDSKVDAQRAGGGLMGSGFGGNAVAGVKLSGISQTDMQAITDAAYSDFVKRLEAAGYQVLDRSVLLQQEDFAKARPESSPQRQDASFFGSKTAMTYVAPSSHGNLYWFMGESSDAGKIGGFGFSNATTAALAFSSKTGIRILSGYYVIDFANSDGYGGQFRRTAGVQVGQALTLAPDGGITLLGGSGRSVASQSGSIKLGQPLYAEESYGEVIGTTGDVEKGVEVALNLVSALSGLGGSNQRRDFEVQADPQRYRQLSESLITQANGQLIERMASLR